LQHFLSFFISLFPFLLQVFVCPRRCSEKFLNFAGAELFVIHVLFVMPNQQSQSIEGNTC